MTTVLRDLESVLRDLAVHDDEHTWQQVAHRLHVHGLSGDDLALRWADYTEAVEVVEFDRGDVVYGDLCRSNVEAARRMACDRESDALHGLIFGWS